MLVWEVTGVLLMGEICIIPEESMCSTSLLCGKQSNEATLAIVRVPANATGHQNTHIVS